MGGLGNGPHACKTVHRKMHCKRRDTTTVVLMYCTLLAHAFVSPLTQVIRQHTTSLQLSIQGVLTQNRPAFLVGGEPAQYFRASHDHYTGPTIAVVTTSTPKPTETADLGPHDMGSVHHSSTCPFAPFSAHASASLLCAADGPLSPHGTFSRFQLSVAIESSPQSFCSEPLISGVGLCLRKIKYKGRQAPWFLHRPAPVGFGFLLHRLFRGFEQATNVVP